MFIQTEITPNPMTLKFIPGRVVMEKGTAFFPSKEKTLNSPFAKRLFKVDGVEGVFFGADFITITKNQDSEWDLIKPMILGAITDHYSSNDSIIIKKNKKNNELKDSKNLDSEIVKQIKELIETRVRPAVAMDGGDIVFENYENGIVYLHMQGSCAGCPSSMATLKNGIENMLKHYVPEVTEVRPIG